MTSSEFKSASATIRLVPWDPDNEKQVERLYHQRVACSWKQDMIGKWREEQRRGFMSIHWIVIDDSDPLKEQRLAAHVKTYPNEAEPLEDTATSLYDSPRTPPTDAVPFLPVGHISLDAGNLTNPDVDTIEEGIFWVTTLYVSRAIQNAGIGRAAMDAIETLATNAPWKARYLGLDTVDREWKQPDGLPPSPPIVNQSWYERRGYEVFLRKPAGYMHKVTEDLTIAVDLVFMKKKIVS